LAAVLQIAVHFHHIVELEYTIDDRLERAARKAPGNVLHCGLPARLVARDQPDAVPLDRGILRIISNTGIGVPSSLSAP
jgi:hypothetical protein